MAPDSKFWQIYYRLGRQKLHGACQGLADFWNQNSGDWQWIEEKQRPIAALNRDLWRSSVPSISFYALVSLSSIISTLGLLAGSVATIIGAMIIAPLMGPIIGTAYALVVGNRRLLKRSALTTFKGVVMAVVSSVMIAMVLGLQVSNSEIMSRGQPTLIDLGVALAAGAAGAFAKSRHRIADALPGVAIAVALVPPLSVVGIGLAWGNLRLVLGASLLFATNLIGIIFSGALIFLLGQYGSVERAKTGLIAGLLSLVFLGLPLGWSLRNILIREHVRRQVATLIRQQTLTFADTEVSQVNVKPRRQSIYVELEVEAVQQSITQKQVRLVRDFLVQELQQPVQLKVRVIPTEIFEDMLTDP